MKRLGKKEQREQTRRQILDAAIPLLAKRGYSSTTMQQLADAIGMTSGALYWHFDSKEDLLASGIENLRESLKQRQRQALSARGSDEGIFAFSRELFTHANEHRTVFQAMVGKRSGAVVQQMLQKMLVDLVRDEVRATGPERANDTPVEAVSQFIGGGLFGLLIWWGNGKMRMAVDDVDSMFRRLAIPSLKAAAR